MAIALQRAMWESFVMKPRPEVQTKFRKGLKKGLKLSKQLSALPGQFFGGGEETAQKSAAASADGSGEDAAQVVLPIASRENSLEFIDPELENMLLEASPPCPRKGGSCSKGFTIRGSSVSFCLPETMHLCGSPPADQNERGGGFPSDGPEEDVNDASDYDQSVICQVTPSVRFPVDNLPLLLQDEFTLMGFTEAEVKAMYADIKAEINQNIKAQMVDYISRAGDGEATIQRFWDDCINGGADAAGRENPFECRSPTPIQELWKAAFALAWLRAKGFVEHGCHDDSDDDCSEGDDQVEFLHDAPSGKLPESSPLSWDLSAEPEWVVEASALFEQSLQAAKETFDSLGLSVDLKVTVVAKHAKKKAKSAKKGLRKVGLWPAKKQKTSEDVIA